MHTRRSLSALVRGRFIVPIVAVLTAAGAQAQTPPLDLPSQFAMGQAQNVALNGTGTSAFLALEPQATLAGWQASPNKLPNSISNHTLLRAGNRLYLVGGQKDPNTLYADVLIAQIGADGTPSAFTPAKNPLPAPRGLHGGAIYNSVIYVVGGDSPDVGAVTADVLMSRIGADGEPGAWALTTSLPDGRDWLTVFATKGHLYAIGGAPNGPLAGTTTSWVAPINADGTLGDWKAGPSLSPNLERYGAAGYTIGDRIGLAGGVDIDSSSGNAQEVVSADVEESALDQSGMPGQWSQQPPLPAGRGYVQTAAALSHGRLFLVGGLDPSLQADGTTLTAGITASGTLATWTTGPAIPTGLSRLAVAATGSTLISTGGQESGGLNHDDVFVGSLTFPMSPPPSPYGVFESPVIDLGKEAAAGQLGFTSSAADGGTLSVQWRAAPASGVFGDWSATALVSPIDVTGTPRFLQYRVVMTATGAASPELTGIAIIPPKPSVVYGDITGDGKVDVQDAIAGLRIATRLQTPTDAQILAGDVAPKPGANGQPFGDGRINVQDVIRILRSVVKLDTLP